MLSLKSTALTVLLLTTTACTPIWQKRPDVSPDLLWQTRRQALTELEQWKIRGRTVITQGREAWNAGLRWQQDYDAYQIKIEGPFSQGGITLDGTDSQAILTMNDGQKIVSADPELLIAQAIGVKLPVNALRDWVRGIPSPEQKIALLELDEDGQITHLIQQDWDISFRRYMPFSNQTLPAKIFIKNKDLSLRLVITSWNQLK